MIDILVAFIAFIYGGLMAHSGITGKTGFHMWIIGFLTVIFSAVYIVYRTTNT